VVKAPLLREAPAHAFVVLVFLAVALVASPRFADQFTSVKWYALVALGLAWFLAEWLREPAGPRLSRWAAVSLSAFVALVVAGSLRQGPAWAMEPLLARSGFALVALASFSYFRRTDLALGPLRASVAAACAIVVALGFLQLAGLRPLPGLTAGDQVSATFGNVNMAAQFVALGLVVVLSGIGGEGEPPRSRAAVVALAVLGAAGLAYLHLLGTRSAPLALTAALAFLLVVDRRAALLRLAAGGALVVAILRFLPGAAGPPQSGGTSAHKRESVRVRFAVWSDTWDLVRDRPLGVGAGNFEQAFIPYALGGRTRPDESLVFRSPHNEYLRFLAEEGLAASALLAVLLIGLGVALHRSPTVASWRSPPGRLLGSVSVFLAVEAFFQFPFEMAFPALTAAVMLGLAGACLGPSSAVSRRGAWRLLAVVAAAGVVWALVRVVQAERLWVGARSDVRAQEEACRLDPRRLEACTQGAWLRIGSGDHETGRRALVEVLERAPHYYPAIKLLGEDSMARGDRETGCLYLGVYDALFDGRSALHERIRHDCPPAALDVVRRRVSIPYYQAFPFATGDR
jgi:O-antigen ligase